MPKTKRTNFKGNPFHKNCSIPPLANAGTVCSMEAAYDAGIDVALKIIKDDTLGLRPMHPEHRRLLQKIRKQRSWEQRNA